MNKSTKILKEELSKDFKLEALKFFTDTLRIKSKIQIEDGAPNVKAENKVADIFFPKAGIFTMKITADDSFEFIRELAHNLIHVKQIDEKRLKLINPRIVEFDGVKYPIDGEDYKSEESDTPFDKEANKEGDELANKFWNRNIKESVNLKLLPILESIMKPTSHYVYHGSNKKKEIPHDGMFFSEDSNYARSIGGSHVQLALINPKNPLYLEKYNKILRDAGKELHGEDIFQIGSYYLQNNYSTQISYLYSSGFQKDAIEFQKEYKNCDAIFGDDAGHRNSKVWYIKYASEIQFI